MAGEFGVETQVTQTGIDTDAARVYNNLIKTVLIPTMEASGQIFTGFEKTPNSNYDSMQKTIAELTGKVNAWVAEKENGSLRTSGILSSGVHGINQDIIKAQNDIVKLNTEISNNPDK